MSAEAALKMVQTAGRKINPVGTSATISRLRTGWILGSRDETRQYDWDVLKFQADYDPNISAHRCAIWGPAVPVRAAITIRFRPNTLPLLWFCRRVVWAAAYSYGRGGAARVFV